MKVNLGCGRHILPGWVNVDAFPAPGVDRVVDLDNPPDGWEPNSVDEFLMSHVLEHLREPLRALEWCWRVAKPGAVLTAHVPYGSSDDADADPTHVRRMFVGSWLYFAQPAYWRADYGYRGDWQCRRLLLRVDGKRFPAEATELQVRTAISTVRNVVLEMRAELVAVKPIREPNRSLQEAFLTDIEVVP